MILIKKDTVNNIYVTFFELMLDTTNPIKFKLENEFSREEKEMELTFADNLSTTSRWQIYEITESDTEDLPNLTISLKKGTYTYTAYEVDNSIERQIETGQLIVN